MVAAISSKIDLRSFAEAVWLCGGDERFPRTINGLNLPENEEGLVIYCMHFGPKWTIEQLLPTRKQVEELCVLLDIPSMTGVSRANLIEQVVSVMSAGYPLRTPIRSFSILGRYIEQVERLHQQENAEKVLECVKRLETLIKEIYRLYVCEILYRFLDTKDKRSVKNTLQSKKFGDWINQLRKFENNLKGNRYPDAQDELKKLNGQSSIFGLASIDTVQQIATIRGDYLAHESEHSKSLLTQKYRELFTYTKEFVSACVDVMPKVIVPIQFSVNEWNFRYI